MWSYQNLLTFFKNWETSDSFLSLCSVTPGCSEITSDTSDSHLCLTQKSALFLMLVSQKMEPRSSLTLCLKRQKTPLNSLKKWQWECLAFPRTTWEPGFPGTPPASRNGLEGVLQLDRKTSQPKVCEDSAVCALRMCREPDELFMGISFSTCITASYYRGNPYGRAGVPFSLVPL